MPEILEVETYRRQATRVVGRTIGVVGAPDAWFVKGAEPAEVVAVTGRRVAGARRLGKLLVLDLDDGPDPAGLRPAESDDEVRLACASA